MSLPLMSHPHTTFVRVARQPPTAHPRPSRRRRWCGGYTVASPEEAHVNDRGDRHDEQVQRVFLRHCLATIAYRGGKAIRDAPEGFAKFRAAPESRSAGEILAHVGDLFDWACSLVEGRHHWEDSAARSWAAECERFFAGLGRFDAALAETETLGSSAEQIG